MQTIKLTTGHSFPFQGTEITNNKTYYIDNYMRWREELVIKPKTKEETIKPTNAEPKKISKKSKRTDNLHRDTD